MSPTDPVAPNYPSDHVFLPLVFVLNFYPLQFLQRLNRIIEFQQPLRHEARQIVSSDNVSPVKYFVCNHRAVDNRWLRKAGSQRLDVCQNVTAPIC